MCWHAAAICSWRSPRPTISIDLRAIVQGEGVARERTDGVIREHERHFSLIERTTAREHHRLDRDMLRDLLRGTYRGERHAVTRKLEDIDTLDLTLASDMLAFSH